MPYARYSKETLCPWAELSVQVKPDPKDNLYKAFAVVECRVRDCLMSGTPIQSKPLLEKINAKSAQLAMDETQTTANRGIPTKCAIITGETIPLRTLP